MIKSSYFCPNTMLRFQVMTNRNTVLGDYKFMIFFLPKQVKYSFEIFSSVLQQDSNINFFSQSSILLMTFIGFTAKRKQRPCFSFPFRFQLLLSWVQGVVTEHCAVYLELSALCRNLVSWTAQRMLLGCRVLHGM